MIASLGDLYETSVVSNTTNNQYHQLPKRFMKFTFTSPFCNFPSATSLAFAFTTLIPLTSSGALIGSWTSDRFVTDGTLDGSTVIQTTGTYAAGWNAGNGADITVNGVEFLNNPDDDNGVDITGGGNAVTTVQNTGEFTGDFQTLMSTIEFNGDAGAPGYRSFTIGLEGLTIGTRYRIQFLSHQVTSTFAARDMQIFFGSDTSGASTGLFQPAENTTGPSVDGYSWTAVFDADALTQDFYVNGASGEVPIINAVSVYAIPEPSTFVLLGLGASALIARRRR